MTAAPEANGKNNHDLVAILDAGAQYGKVSLITDEENDVSDQVPLFSGH